MITLTKKYSFNINKKKGFHLKELKNLLTRYEIIILLKKYTCSFGSPQKKKKKKHKSQNTRNQKKNIFRTLEHTGFNKWSIVKVMS